MLCCCLCAWLQINAFMGRFAVSRSWLALGWFATAIMAIASGGWGRLGNEVTGSNWARAFIARALRGLRLGE